jgi:DNA-binding MarR family transcriptional regulator
MSLVTGKAFETAVIDFARSIGLLVRRARAAAPSRELSWSELAVLKRLAAGAPATTADLARAEGMRPQSMRAVVAALEQRKLVTRKPNAADGRQVYIELSARGAAEEMSAADARRTWLAQTISRLTPRERETLFAAGEIIKRRMSSPQ